MRRYAQVVKKFGPKKTIVHPLKMPALRTSMYNPYVHIEGRSVNDSKYHLKGGDLEDQILIPTPNQKAAIRTESTKHMLWEI